MKNISRFLAAAVTAAVCCAAPLKAGDSIFVTAIPEMASTLDPAVMYDRYSVMIALNIYEPLVAFKDKFYTKDFVPALSSEVPSAENGLISKDGRTYTFPIRKDIKFHDGTPLTAEDVRYSLLRLMLADRTDGPSNIFLKPILGVNSTRDANGRITLNFKDAAAAVRTDGDKLVIKLVKPYPPFLALVAAWPFTTSKQWAVANGEWDGTEATWKQYNDRPREKSWLTFNENGTGPFKLENFDPRKGRMELARNKDYWGPAPKLERIVFVRVVSEMTRQNMLETGDADYAEFDRSSVKDLSRLPGVTIEDGLPNYSLGTILAFTFKINVSSNPMVGSGKLDGKGIPPDFFSDVNIRKAFAYAFDYDKFLHSALRGHGGRRSGPIPRFGVKQIPPFNYDPQEAEKYFKKAFGGKVWENGFRFTAVFPIGDSEAEEAYEILAKSLKQINPKFEMRTRPLRPIFAKLGARNHYLPIFIRSFEPDYPDYYNLAFNMMHSEGLMPKYQLYSNPKADKLCEKALYAKGEEQEKTYKKLDALYAKDVPQIYFFAPSLFKAYRTTATGMNSAGGVFMMHNFVDYSKVSD